MNLFIVYWTNRYDNSKKGKRETPPLNLTITGVKAGHAKT